MDLPSLAMILQAALSPNPDERKAAEQNLNQVWLLPIIEFPFWSEFPWICTYLIHFRLSVYEVRTVVRDVMIF